MRRSGERKPVIFPHLKMIDQLEVLVTCSFGSLLWFFAPYSRLLLDYAINKHQATQQRATLSFIYIVILRI